MNPSLQNLLQRLPELDVILRAADFTVSPDRWQSVYDLIYRLDREQRLPDHPQAFAVLIAPLFCNNKAEQQAFYSLFRQWVGGEFESADGAAEVLHHSTLARNQQQAYERQTRKRPLWSFVLVFLLLAALVAWYNSKPQSQAVTQPANTANVLELIAGNEIAIKSNPVSEPVTDPKLTQGLQTIPPRQPSEEVQLDEQGLSDMQFMRDLLLSLPLVFLLAWLLRRWSRKQALQRFHRGLYDNPLLYLKLRRNNKTLPFGWGEFSQRLKRTGSIETRKLDIERTIDKTIHHAGLFTPVRLKRERQPAYLVLMNRANSQDHLTDRANSLFDRLKEANVTVYRFEYHQDPRLCFSTGQSRKAHSLNQLARHYAGCRLILIGDGEALIDPFSGEAQRWVRQFEAWNTRVLLTPAPQPWDARETQIAHAGFAVAPFRVNGLEAVSDWLLKPSLDAVWFKPGNEEPLPELFALDEAVWLTGAPPPGYGASATCAVLFDYLGQSGYRLLTACAAYPQLVSELTLTLDQILFPADNGAAREKRLVRLTRLPWFSEGHLPEYLRRDLLERAGETQIERFRDAYIGIFKNVTKNLFARAGKTMLGWMTNRYTLSVIGVLILTGLIWFIGPMIKFGGNNAGPLEAVNNRFIAIIVCAGLWGFGLLLKGKLSKQNIIRQQMHDGSRDYIRDLVRFAPDGSPMADGIFTDVILGGQRDLLDVVLPGRLVKGLPGKQRYRLWPLLLASFLAAMLVTGLYFGWSLSSPVLEQAMVQQMKAGNAAITVQISGNEDTRALGDALQASLTEWGFRLAPRLYAKPLNRQVTLDDQQRKSILSEELTRQQLSKSIDLAAKSLRPDLDRLFKSFQQQYAAFGSNTVIKEISSLSLPDLQARLVQSLSSADVQLDNQRKIDTILQKGINEWSKGIDSSIRLMAAGIVSSSKKAEKLTSTKIFGNKIQESLKRTIPSSTDIEALLQKVIQSVRSQLPGLVMKNLGDVSARIVRQYQMALNEKFKLAGEEQRNIPDAVVYLDGYQNAAQSVQQRLAYLTYDSVVYPLLPDQGIVLKAGENPAQISVNLSQPLSPGGTLRDRIKQQPAQLLTGLETVVLTTGTVISLKSNNGRYLSRCNNCVPGSGITDSITVHIDDKNFASYAHFKVQADPSANYLGLQTNNGKFLAACAGCEKTANSGIIVTAEGGSPKEAPQSRISMIRLDNGKVALELTTLQGVYLIRCQACIRGAAKQDNAIFIQTDPHTNPLAQWELNTIKKTDTAKPDSSPDQIEWPISQGGNGHVYQYVRSKKSWTEAKLAAEKMSVNGMLGHLASITSKAENDFIVKLRKLSDLRAWIGLRYDRKQNRFNWITGEKVKYVNWSKGEPNHLQGEDFVEMFASAKWNDNTDGFRYNQGFIVEFEPTK